MESPLRDDVTEGSRVLPREVSVAIVGAGFSGLGMAIRLREEGMDDFLVLERNADVGGKWWNNTYPGCACDVPSHLYSFSFAPNPNWTRTYSPQPEILDYMRSVASDRGVMPHVHLGCAVLDARWDEHAQRWRLDTSQGPLVARVLVAGTGPLSEPSIPELPGLASFTGETVHTARWNHDLDLRGKRVAVIGTGATAIQLVPQLQQQVERLYVVQRTPPWVLPHTDRPIRDVERAIYNRVPAAQRAVRSATYWARETFAVGFTRDPRVMSVAERLARRHLRRQVADPQLRARLTPDYRIGCKRILLSNDYYPALQQPNVELVTTGIADIGASTITTHGGGRFDVDVIVLATGFEVTDVAAAHHLRGRGGRLLADEWDGSPQAYLGTSIAGFPNLFFVVGPNTGLGHSSMVFMIEAQLHYLLQALRSMREHRVESIEVRREVQQQYNRELQERMQRTVWTTGGCTSWYLDRHGRNPTLWPSYTFRFWQQLRSFRPADYHAVRAVDGDGFDGRRLVAGMTAGARQDA